ncbi:YkvA family protein [Dethiothermospora halolimnae]|uniref:YkvA family protein n=1 Tax=Dethiothermospora halolimnae TaxID=3114390 RepID=UPI003CCBAEF0
MKRRGKIGFLKKIPLAIKFLFDKEVPLRKKIWLILGLVYVVSPIDLIPAPILFFSALDDMAIVAFILTKLSDDLEEYALEQERKKKEEDIEDKIIEDVDYDIKDNDK